MRAYLTWSDGGVVHAMVDDESQTNWYPKYRIRSLCPVGGVHTIEHSEQIRGELGAAAVTCLWCAVCVVSGWGVPGDVPWHNRHASCCQ